MNCLETLSLFLLYIFSTIYVQCFDCFDYCKICILMLLCVLYYWTFAHIIVQRNLFRLLERLTWDSVRTLTYSVFQNHYFDNFYGWKYPFGSLSWSYISYNLRHDFRFICNALKNRHFFVFMGAPESRNLSFGGKTHIFENFG